MAQQVIDNGDSGLEARDKLNANFTDLYAAANIAAIDAKYGKLRPTAMTVAAIQAAFSQAVVNAFAGSGPVHVVLEEPGVYSFLDTVHASAATAGVAAFGTRIPCFGLTIGQNVTVKKTNSSFQNNALYTLWVCDNLFIDIKGKLEGYTNPYMFTAGDDGIRIWSPRRCFIDTPRLQYFGDSAMRIAAHSADTDPDGAHDIVIRGADIRDSGQFSTTNTSGSKISFKRMLIDGGYFDNLNSFKCASRGPGTTRLIIRDAFFTNMDTPAIEPDGPSDIQILNCKVTSSVGAVRMLSNNSLIDDHASDHSFSDVRIKNLTVDGCINGVEIAPDTQCNNLDFKVRNVDVDMVFKNCVDTSGVAFKLIGSFENVRADITVENHGGNLPAYLLLRESRDIKVKVRGDISRSDGNGHAAWVERYTSAGTLPNVNLIEDVEFDLTNLRVGSILRYWYADGVKGLTIKGDDVKGAVAAMNFHDSARGGIEDFVLEGNLATTGGNGVILNNTRRGQVRNAKITAATSTPLVIGSTSAGIDYTTNVRCFNGAAPAFGGNGAGISDSQGPVMASASRTTTQVDVTITHGLGTDFTVPTNAARAFRFFKSDGTEIKITAAARQSATVLRLTLATDPAAANNVLVCLDRPQYNVLNGGFGWPSDRPYDNSSSIAHLRVGTLSVA